MHKKEEKAGWIFTALFIFILLYGGTVAFSFLNGSSNGADRLKLGDSIPSKLISEPKTSATFVFEGNQALDAYCPSAQNGTLENPYIIENLDVWELGDEHGIEICNTNAYLIIRNSLFLHGFLGYAGILLNNCTNVNITNCDTSVFSNGIKLVDSDNNIIMNCTFGGITGQYDALGIGVALSESHNNTVYNNVIRFAYDYIYGFEGIYLQNSHDNVLSYNDISGSSEHGIYASQSHGNFFIANTIRSCNYNGICLESSSENYISANIIENNERNGIHLEDSNTTQVDTNQIKNNAWGIYLHESNQNSFFANNLTGNIIMTEKTSSDNSFDPTNLVNMKPVRYFEAETNVVCAEVETGQLILLNCNGGMIEKLSPGETLTNVLVVNSESLTVQKNNFTGSDFCSIFVYRSRSITISDNRMVDPTHESVGVYLDWSSNCSLANNYCEGQHTGLYISLGANHTVAQNECYDNEENSIYLFATNSTYVFNNTCQRPKFAGIYLDFADLNTVLYNSVSNSTHFGITVLNSSANDILGNNCTYNDFGGISTTYAYDNLFGWNMIAHNNFGIIMISSSENVFHHNNFINNSMHALGDAVENYWDYQGYGNYWDNYTGEDVNGDGIGDSPVEIEGEPYNDTAPLMAPATFNLNDFIDTPPSDDDSTSDDDDNSNTDDDTAATDDDGSDDTASSDDDNADGISIVSYPLPLFVGIICLMLVVYATFQRRVSLS